MAIKNFPENQFIRIFGENEKLMISKQVLSSCELSNMRVKIYSKGLNHGKARLIIYPQDNIYVPDNLAQPAAISNWLDLYLIESNFYGLVKFDFNRENISSGNFEIYFELTDYTRNSYDDYFSLVFDFPLPVYGSRKDYFNQAPIAIEVFSYL